MPASQPPTAPNWNPSSFWKKNIKNTINGEIKNMVKHETYSNWHITEPQIKQPIWQEPRTKIATELFQLYETLLFTGRRLWDTIV